ncbi:hypothetical protein V8E36_007479 [Tilletia maclaganii]
MSAGGAAYYGNGNGHAAPSLVPSRLIVSTINLPVAAHQGTGETEDIEIHTDELLDNINDVVDIFKSEAKPLPTRYVKDVALQALFQGGTEQAIRILHIGLERILDFRPRPDQEHYYEKWPLATLLASLSTSQSRTAPKVVIPDAKFQNVSAQRPKAHYLAEAHGLLFGRPNQPRLIETRNEKRPAVLLTRALLLSLSGVPADLDTSLKLYDTVLNLDGNANNAVALLGKASILLRKRMFMQALRTYQHALKVTIVLGQSKWRGPDPRIGIGLCLHSLGRTDDARTAWTRAVELAAQSPYPQSSGTSASLLLGISSLNIARSTSPLVPGSFGAYVNVTETEARDRAYESGIKATQVAFQASSRAVLTAAIILEPVLGEGGYVSAPDAFLKGLRSICDEHDILLIADEVQSGYGRTGTFWSIQHSGVRPDILIFAKGTANGFVLSGIASRKELMDREKPGTQGGAYSANAVSCSAAIAVLDVFEREKILDNACDIRPNTSTSGTCVQAGEHVSCTSDDLCYSGVCEEMPCYSHGCAYSGGDRGTWCASVPAGEACRFDGDCSFQAGTTCSDNDKCFVVVLALPVQGRSSVLGPHNQGAS